MKRYEGKLLKDVLKQASEDLNVPVENLKYTIISEVKTLFKKSCVIEIEEENE